MTMYLGEIRLFAGDFAPVGWALCDGAKLTISEHPSLFSLLGVAYGGDGIETFGLPNLIDRIPVHSGVGPGLAPTLFGPGGESEIRLPAASWPAHSHAFVASLAAATTQTPSNGLFAVTPASHVCYGPAPSAGEPGLTAQEMNAGAVQRSTGEGAPVSLGMPDLGLTYIICLEDGEYPVKEEDR